MYRDSIIERRLSGVKVVQVAGRTEDILVGVGKLETVGTVRTQNGLFPAFHNCQCQPYVETPSRAEKLLQVSPYATVPLRVQTLRA